MIYKKISLMIIILVLTIQSLLRAESKIADDPQQSNSKNISTLIKESWNAHEKMKHDAALLRKESEKILNALYASTCPLKNKPACDIKKDPLETLRKEFNQMLCIARHIHTEKKIEKIEQSIRIINDFLKNVDAFTQTKNSESISENVENECREMINLCTTILERCEKTKAMLLTGLV